MPIVPSGMCARTVRWMVIWERSKATCARKEGSPIRVDRQVQDDQVVKVAPPLWMEEGEYVGIQNSSSELCASWEASWGGAGTGGMCLSLDDHSDHGQYIWKFGGGMASEPDSRLLNTTGRLKERHVGFSAILTPG